MRHIENRGYFPFYPGVCYTKCVGLWPYSSLRITYTIKSLRVWLVDDRFFCFVGLFSHEQHVWFARIYSAPPPPLATIWLAIFLSRDKMMGKTGTQADTSTYGGKYTLESWKMSLGFRPLGIFYRWSFLFHFYRYLGYVIFVCMEIARGLFKDIEWVCYRRTHYVNGGEVGGARFNSPLGEKKLNRFFSIVGGVRDW